MMEKVKITQIQSDLVQEVVTEYSKPNVIREHVSGNWGGKFQTLNKIPLHDLIQAVYIGYEIAEEYKAGDHFTIFVGGKKVIGVLKDDNRVYWSDGDESDIDNVKSLMSHGDVKLSSPEEIKAEQERRLWKSIGRECNDFHIGDVALTNYGDSLRVYNSTGIAKLKHHNKNNMLKGFYPAESFIKFEGDSGD